MSETDDDSAVAQVAAELRGLHKRETVTDEQRLLWQLEFKRVRESRAKHQREQAEAEQAKAAERAFADAEARRRASREAMERSQRSREQSDLYSRLQRMEQRQTNALIAAQRNAVHQRNQALLDDLDRTINPPTALEPSVVIVEQQTDGSPDFGSDFNPALFNSKNRSWW